MLDCQSQGRWAMPTRAAAYAAVWPDGVELGGWGRATGSGLVVVGSGDKIEGASLLAESA